MTKRNTDHWLSIGAFRWVNDLVMPGDDNPILLLEVSEDLRLLHELSDLRNAIIHLKCFDTSSKGSKDQ